MPGMVLRPMSVGEILDRAFQVYRRSFAPMYLLSLIGALPFGLLMLAIARGGTAGALQDPSGSLTAIVGLAPIALLSSLLCWGALAELVERSVKGAPAGVGAGLARGVRALLPLLGAVIVVAILCAVVSVPFGVVFGVAGALAGGAAAHRATTGAIMVVLGLAMVAMGLLLLVLWVSLGFFLAPVVVVEHKGAIGVVGRSWELGKGARMRVVGLALVAFIIGVLPGVALDILPLLLSGLRAQVAPGTLSSTTGGLYLALKIAASALTTPFTAGCMMMAYYDRRVRREGLDVELASAALEGAE